MKFFSILLFFILFSGDSFATKINKQKKHHTKKTGVQAHSKLNQQKPKKIKNDEVAAESEMAKDNETEVNQNVMEDPDEFQIDE